ncbi:hypothetical protein Misp01_08320 [Microtetraspora sp. NBRC 13810]|uniref:hypothetical protein n=1 Tax=Microtetraspora sp. NBRC 13810 TaxID=3030990 RepID=UPI0024A12B3B|nr:hypothetical protein [Microtetraspora sp. NBRC 13810]GLW05702.1 hypothetical protein Misp01_08320 [Microtetraspora sp. NBRC 13810]
MLRIARAALFAVIPAELLLLILIVSGVSLPFPVLVAAEFAVVSVLTLEAVTAYRLFRAERRAGASRPAALRGTYDRLVPAQVRKIMHFDFQGVASIALWVARRRHGVPPGATAVPYASGQSMMTWVFIFAMVLETVALELMLQSMNVPTGLRVAVLVIDVYSVVFALGLQAGAVTRPHVVSPDELRVRYGAFFDLRVPRELITSVQTARSFNETGMVTAADGRVTVAISSRINVVVHLSEPVPVTRPLGRRTEATTIRFYADDPKAALQALQPRHDRADALR